MTTADDVATTMTPTDLLNTEQTCHVCGQHRTAKSWSVDKGYRCEACGIRAKIEHIERLADRLPEYRARLVTLDNSRPTG